MAINILSWNIKGFTSSIRYAGNHFDVLQRIMYTFDLICIYEIPNSNSGTTCLGSLVTALNQIGGRHYAGYSIASGGIGKEDDRVGVIYETNLVNVADTTNTRRPGGFSGRAPIYMDVTEINNGNTCEFCAWHAPEPKNATQLIAQGWQNILHNSIDNNRASLTGVVMGDFNGVLTTPKRGGGKNLGRQIATGINNGTTLRSGISTAYNTTAPYRTGNTYDQIYVDGNLVGTIGNSGVYNVLSKLATNAAPFTGAFGTQYNTPLKAYQFYKRISDHLPVAITLTL